ncbi:hydrolase [Campylobacter sp. MIT 12-8780]|uniref:cysteine hydrolase family protein n=1 Tax=Campylobacter sp. MIT 12-8780 TaxID=2202200 RepID=UPI00115DDDB0|nr:isochorismatase family cysteine hydrolase [Campylobacter sp. MIT 12-8780]TQR40244.1 hydrolase [Campylobacter sp. MIT 12-8780]
MKKAFVLVDYQNDFIDGALGFEKAAKLKDEIKRLLENFDGDILITLDTHDENYLNTKEGINLPIKHCLKGTQGHNVPSFCEPFKQRSKKIFEKHTFGSLELAQFLKEGQYEQIEFGGLVSHICVFHNIILAFNAGLNTKLVLHKNATASFDEDLQNAAFKLLEAFWVELV